MMVESNKDSVTVRPGRTFIVDGEVFKIEEIDGDIIRYTSPRFNTQFSEPADYFRERLVNADMWYVKEIEDVSASFWQNKYKGGRA